MHIPDGYLGPPTCIAGYAVMLPLWAIASRRVRSRLQARQVPLLAIAAAFCFVIMMFNIPIPGGSTGHAVGAVLAAVLLGPWAACIAVSVALVIQALLFGDGGITALGANCFNMAFVLPFVGYAVYRTVAARSSIAGLRRVIAAGLGGYAGLVVASLFAGFEFGLQPLLHHTASGVALYCPYHFGVAIPAMVGGHALVFGWVEFIVTALVVKFIQVQDPSLLNEVPATPGRRLSTRLVIGLVTLAIASPLGLFLPRLFKAGGAWGEWSGDELQKLVGYVPKGVEHLSMLWKAPLPDYVPRGLTHENAGYIISAILGIALCVGLGFAVGKILSRRNRPSPKRHNGFIEGAVMGAASLLRETLENEAVASRKGFLQQSDPRMKVLCFVLLLATTMLSRTTLPLFMLYLLCLTAGALSRVPPLFFMKRTLPFIPLFSLFLVAPALFSGVSPGDAAVGLRLFGHALIVTRQGISTASLLILRVTVSVSLAALLVLTTRHHALLKTLRLFGIPQLFVMIIGMSYRYILLLIDIIQNTFLGIKSRVGFVTSSRTGRHIAAANMASLWLRSYRLHSQVYDAMLSRGYTGEPVVSQDFSARAVDYVLLSIALLAMIGTLCSNRFFH